MESVMRAAPRTVATLMTEIVVSVQMSPAIPVILKNLRMMLVTMSVCLCIAILTTFHVVASGAIHSKPVLHL